MRRFNRLLALVLLASASAGCSPADELTSRIARLPEGIHTVVRDAVWAHGNPYVWVKQRNVLLETHWSDYRHGRTPMVNHKIYTIDLKSRRMRIDDLSTDTVALYDGVSWRVFIQGREIKKPDVFSAETAPYLAMLEYAASEMRIVRTFFCLPFNLLDNGVRLKGLGQVRSMAGGNIWNVIRVTFDLNATGYLETDRILVYFDPGSSCVYRVFLRLSGEPFYSMPFWGEWADYRRMPNGMVVPHRWEFRRTDGKGGADLGRRLSIIIKKVAFNVALPWNIFGSPDVKPPPIPEQGAGLRPRTIGVDVIDK